MRDRGCQPRRPSDVADGEVHGQVASGVNIGRVHFVLFGKTRKLMVTCSHQDQTVNPEAPVDVEARLLRASSIISQSTRVGSLT